MCLFAVKNWWPHILYFILFLFSRCWLITMFVAYPSSTPLAHFHYFIAQGFFSISFCAKNQSIFIYFYVKRNMIRKSIDFLSIKTSSFYHLIVASRSEMNKYCFCYFQSWSKITTRHITPQAHCKLSFLLFFSFWFFCFCFFDSIASSVHFAIQLKNNKSILTLFSLSFFFYFTY